MAQPSGGKTNTWRCLSSHNTPWNIEAKKKQRRGCWLQKLSWPNPIKNNFEVVVPQWGSFCLGPNKVRFFYFPSLRSTTVFVFPHFAAATTTTAAADRPLINEWTQGPGPACLWSLFTSVVVVVVVVVVVASAAATFSLFTLFRSGHWAKSRCKSIQQFSA